MISSLRDTVARLAATRRSRRIPELRLVIVGLPRSGTRFAAHLSRPLGLRCGHEWVFDAPRPPLKTALGSLLNPQLGRAQADASWLAAPQLDRLPPTASILHQIRNPVHVVRSLMGIRFFQRPPHDRLYGYTQFACQHLPDLPADPLEACMAFWVRWNRLIESHRGPHDYLAYRLEDLASGDSATLAQFARRISAGNVQQLSAALAHLPNDVNRRQRDGSIAFRSLPAGRWKDQLVQQAAGYGYSVVELERS
jgi:hypothetical protein